MIILVFSVPCMVALFSFLSSTNSFEPALVDSFFRSLLMWGVSVAAVVGMFFEVKYLDARIIKWFCNFMEDNQDS